jgi:hypothetical protein
MGIYISDAEPKQPLTVDEMEHLLVRGDSCLRQLPQGVQNEITLPQFAESEFTGYERMSQHSSVVEEPAECSIAGPQMVDPDRCVY